MISNQLVALFFCGLLAFVSCKKDSKGPSIDESVDLDGAMINDSSLANPAGFLLSSAMPNPTPADLAMPVIIAVHGFSASTFEWTEFRDWSTVKKDFKVSVVLLGGHGRDYADFKNANWADWQEPIIHEYNLLKALGYKNINILASSTGCTLVLNMLREEKIESDVLNHVWFIDPIVTPANKTLSMVKVVGPVLGYVTNNMEPGENGFWYRYTPYQALKQLERVIRLERKALDDGFHLPPGVSLTVYKSNEDETVDPVSAVQLQKGIKTSDGNPIKVIMVKSNLHVFTRLHGRNSVSTTDTELQQKTFEEIHNDL